MWIKVEENKLQNLNVAQGVEWDEAERKLTIVWAEKKQSVLTDDFAQSVWDALQEGVLEPPPESSGAIPEHGHLG